jgi:hypothetical protein
MENLIKCPFCGSDKVGKAPHKIGTKFVLPTADINNNISFENPLILEEVIICSNCQSIWFNNPNFKANL